MVINIDIKILIVDTSFQPQNNPSKDRTLTLVMPDILMLATRTFKARVDLICVHWAHILMYSIVNLMLILHYLALYVTDTRSIMSQTLGLYSNCTYV